MIEVKDRRFIIRSLYRIAKAIMVDGVSANSTTSAFLALMLSRPATYCNAGNGRVDPYRIRE